jgi:DNA-directed RNA polymerase specialized sigma24 family protein
MPAPGSPRSSAIWPRTCSEKPKAAQRSQQRRRKTSCMRCSASFATWRAPANRWRAELQPLAGAFRVARKLLARVPWRNSLVTPRGSGMADRAERAQSEHANHSTVASALRAASPASPYTQDAQTRELAAQALLAEIQARAQALVRGHFGAVFRRLGLSDVEALIEDAVQHTLLKVAEAGDRFRGDSDAGARSWYSAVLLNYVKSELRKRRRADAAVSQIADPSAQGVGVPAAELLDFKQEYRDCLRTLRALQVALGGARRLPDTLGATRAIWCHLMHAAGVPTSVQVAIWWPDLASSESADNARVRNRLYQLRRRGLLAVRRILQDYRTNGTID